MVSYPDSIDLKEGLSQYLMNYNLGDGGYTNRWFKINFFWKFTLTLPNVSNRVEAVRFHDLHHVLAEYETGLRGEAEIGAWEIASGCGKYWAAWILNMGSVFYGMFLFPRSTFKAFVRGRHSENLYHKKNYETVLALSVGELREELHLDNAPKTAVGDRVSFIICAALILLIYAAGIFTIFKVVKLFF